MSGGYNKICLFLYFSEKGSRRDEVVPTKPAGSLACQ